MSAAPFVHLHIHSQYSLLDGAIRLRELVETASADGQDAVAVTDHGNLFAAVPFIEEATRAGIKPIVGCEIYVAKGSRHDRRNPPGGKGYNHLILLAANNAGYRNLVRIVSKGYLEGFYYKPRVDLEVLRRHSEGLIALSACLNGVIADPLLGGRLEAAEESIRIYQDIYGGDNFFLELQDHGMDEDRRVVPGMQELSKRTGAPLVATNDAHYLLREDALAHEVLLSIQTGKSMSDPTRWRFANDQFYFKTSAEMVALFKDIPEAIENTRRIADRVDFKLETGKTYLPSFVVPEGQTLDDHFRLVVRAGFEARLPRLTELEKLGKLRHPVAQYEQRLADELDMIIAMQFPGYFLIVWDFIRYAREKGIPVGPGRGSAAGSLVSYCLRITDIDPLQYDLLFERFLNPERVSMPDIDIDFCMRRRGEVISYVTEKYGRENVSQIITFGTMAARAVLRDVGRSLDIPYGECDRIAKLIPAELDATIEKALAAVPQLQELADSDPRVARMIEIARKLEGLTRHASTHAAGVVIAPQPIMEFCPLYKTSKDEIVTQFAKDEVEKIGLLKMDFLGLKTLTVIDDALKSIAAQEGVTLDIDVLPLDDAATFELFCEARTAGVFQFESSGMRDILRRLAPDRFEDLVALNALYRPGAIKGGMIDEFITRRHAAKGSSYDSILAELDEILDETYGVIIYQEQVMRIASKLAGFSLGEADILRRAMGKKKKDVMQLQSEKFLKGARANGVAEPKARKIFELMEHFAEYGFNKSHSAAYALVAYQTAYLKAHYPVHFMAALLTNERESTNNVVKYIGACREMGIEILPPDVNSSDFHFTVTGPRSLRFGLAAIKNVGENAIASLLKARRDVGRFKSLKALLEEVDLKSLNKRAVESLIKSGALDSLGAERSRLAAALDRAIDTAQRTQQDRIVGQVSLFELPGTTSSFSEDLPQVPAWPERERLGYERDTLGFYITGHPLGEHAAALRSLTSLDSASLGQPGLAGTEVRLAGVIATVRAVKTKRGAYMAHMSLEDLVGFVDVVVFPEAYNVCREIVEVGTIVLVTGKLEVEEDGAKILATEVTRIEDAKAKGVREVKIELDLVTLDREHCQRLRELCEKHRGEIPLRFELVRSGAFRASLAAPGAQGIDATPAVIAALEALAGRGRVHVGRGGRR